MKAQYLITKIKTPLGFAVAWPFIAWIIFSILGVKIIGGMLPQQDTIAQIECGTSGGLILTLVQFLPGCLAMMLIRRKLIVNIFGLAAYVAYSTIICILFIYLSLFGYIPNIYIFIDM